MDSQYAAINEETDLALAAQAIPASLKMMEGLLKEDPDNPNLLGKLAEGFCGYAFGFVEDDNPKRASSLYLRGRDYAERELAATGGPEHSVGMNLAPFKESLKGLNADHRHSLYWMGQCWASWLLLNLDNLQVFIVSPKVEAVMQKVLTLDESYHFAGAHLFFGAYYGGRPKIVGGDVNKSKLHFEKALEITQHKFLIAYILYAKTYAVRTQDRLLFKKLLDQVIKAPVELLPGQQLANSVARRKAQKLLESTDDFF